MTTTKLLLVLALGVAVQYVFRLMLRGWQQQTPPIEPDLVDVPQQPVESAVHPRWPEGGRYRFEHVDLPSLVFDESPQAPSREELMSGKALIAAALGVAFRPAHPSPAEFEAMLRSIGIRRQRFQEGACTVDCLVFTMPPPERGVECHFVAVAQHPDGTLGYYTLEAERASGNATHFCGWTREQQHLNFGAGPPADFDRFVDAVGRRICGIY